MAGRPKTRERWEREADEAGIPYEEYKLMKLEERAQDDARKEEVKKRKAEMKEQRDITKVKRSELSAWMVRFALGNMRRYGQAIMDQLAQEDPKAAASFLTQIMKFAAPTVADPEKTGAKKEGTGEETQTAEYKEARDRINRMKKQFEKQQQ